MNGEAPNAPKRGRPAVWADKDERQRQHRARQTEKLRLLDELLHAASNARWADPELHRITQEGDDAELMRALTAHYRQHHWCRIRVAGPDEGGPMPNT